MLDFYLIHDEVPKSSQSNLTCVGGIDEELFLILQEEKVIESHLDYYKDFRWTLSQIKLKIELLKKSKFQNYDKFYEILNTAEKKNLGLLARSD